MTKIDKKQLYVIVGLAGIIATASAFAFPLQTVIAPHPCPPGFIGLPDGTCIQADCALFDPDGHCIEPIPPTSEPACIPEHWDKIIFQILRDPSGTINPNYLKTPLDIKVLDDPTSVANLVAKVKQFIAANGIAVVPGTTFDPTIVPQLKIDIIDVEYAIVCITITDG